MHVKDLLRLQTPTVMREKDLWGSSKANWDERKVPFEVLEGLL